jgi:ElaB/YqjD/DUF883 family membrane-anchored ribosome-binding protein
MNTNASSTSAEKIHSLIDQGASKAENGASSAVDFTARGAHHAVDKTAHLVNKTAEKTAQLADQAQTRYVAAQRQVRHHVSDRPVQALALAAGLGAIIGWLLSRKNIS